MLRVAEKCERYLQQLQPNYRHADGVLHIAVTDVDAHTLSAADDKRCIGGRRKEIGGLIRNYGVCDARRRTHTATGTAGGCA
jgi:hypothetical protein